MGKIIQQDMDLCDLMCAPERKCGNCRHWKPRRPGVRSCRNTMSDYFADEPEEYDSCECWEGEEDECD